MNYKHHFHNINKVVVRLLGNKCRIPVNIITYICISDGERMKDV